MIRSGQNTPFQECNRKRKIARGHRGLPLPSGSKGSVFLGVSTYGAVTYQQYFTSGQFSLQPVLDLRRVIIFAN